MSADLQTPLKRVRGLGSAKDGTHHFIVQRITALALIPLSIWVVWLALALMHADFAQARAILHHPFAAVWLAAFVIAAFWHAQLGMQVVIEDYIHDEKLKLVSIMANNFFSITVALAAAYAIFKLSSGV